MLLLAFLLFSVPCFAQLQLTIPLTGVVNAPIDQNGWQSFKVVLTQNITFSFIVNPPVPPPAQSNLRVIFVQDATGNRSVTFASNISNPCAINATPAATTICQFMFDGTTSTWQGLGNGGGGGGGAQLNLAQTWTALQTLPATICGPAVYDVVCAGADPTGVADSLAAFNSAHNFFNGKNGGTITGCGTFKLSNVWIITNPGLQIKPSCGQSGYRALSPIQDGGFVITGTANLNVPNPATAITVACSNTGGALAAATYYVTYTLVNGSGETLAAPVSTSCTTTGSTGSVTLPHTGGVPYQMGGWAFNVYVSTDGTSAGCTGPGYTTCWKQPSANFANSGGANGGVPFLVGNGQDETLATFSTGTTHPPGSNTATHAFVLAQVGTDPSSPVDAGPTFDGVTFLDTSSVLGGGLAVVNAQRTVVRNSAFEGFNFNGSAMGGQATYQQGGIALAFLNIGNASTNNFPALQRSEFYNNILGFYSEASDVAVDGGMTNFTVPANGMGFDWAGGGIQMRQFHCSGTGSGQVACGSIRGNNNGGAYSGQFTGKAEGLQNYTGPGFKLSFAHNLLLDVQCIGGSAVANSCVQLEANSTANNIRISYQTTGIPFSDGTTALKDPAGGNDIQACNSSGCIKMVNVAAGTVAPAGGILSSIFQTVGTSAGMLALGGSASNGSVAANSAGWEGPSAASFTSYVGQFPSTAPSGGQVLSCSTPVSNISTCTWVTSPVTIASGAVAMPTSAVGAGACVAASAQTATGTATTDSVLWAYNSTPAANPGELVVAWSVQANTVTPEYCNPSAGSITPNAATLNWRVVR